MANSTAALQHCQIQVHVCADGTLGHVPAGVRNPDGMAHSCGTPYFEGVTPAGPAPTPEKTEVPDAEHAAAADERTKDEQSETLDKVTEFENDSDEVHALAQQAAAE